MSVPGEHPSDIELRAMYNQAIVKGKELFGKLRRKLLPKDSYCTKSCDHLLLALSISISNTS